MSNSTIITASNSSRDELLAEVRKACDAHAVNLNKVDTVTAKELAESKEAADAAIIKYNNATLEEQYEEMLATPKPLYTLALRKAYTKQTVSYPTDKTTKAINYQLVQKSTRFNVLSFLDYAKSKETPLENASTLETKVIETARTISDYVLACVASPEKNESGEKTPSPTIAKAKKALDSLIKEFGVDCVHARSVDIRFIVFAATKARKMGELAVINDAAIVPYIMDMFHVQLAGIPYKFEDQTKKKDA